jgi:hypothetical protein
MSMTATSINLIPAGCLIVIVIWGREAASLAFGNGLYRPMLWFNTMALGWGFLDRHPPSLHSHLGRIEYEGKTEALWMKVWSPVEDILRSRMHASNISSIKARSPNQLAPVIQAPRTVEGNYITIYGWLLSSVIAFLSQAAGKSRKQSYE